MKISFKKLFIVIMVFLISSGCLCSNISQSVNSSISLTDIRNTRILTPDLFGITYGKDKFIAVGEAGTILSSDDGKTWENRISGIEESLRSVAWNGKVYTAVGDKGKILYSEDGQVWKEGISGTTNDLNCIIWNGKIFAAAGDSTTILISENGIGWRKAAVNLTASYFWLDINSVTWGKSGFTAVGSGNFTDTLSSEDGSVWSNIKIPDKDRNNYYINESITFSSVCFDEGIYFAASGYPYSGIYQLEGNEWLNMCNDTAGISISSSVAYNKEIIMTGKSGLIINYDEKCKCTFYDTGVSENLNAITIGGGLLVAAGEKSIILASADGKQWTAQNAHMNFRATARGDNKIIAVGEHGVIMVSEDLLKSWNKAASNTVHTLNSVAYGAGRFVAVGGEYDNISRKYFQVILTSIDGKKWIKIHDDDGEPLLDIVWDGGKYLSVGCFGTIRSSKDGAKWKNENSGVNCDLKGVAWNGSVFIAVGGSWLSRGTILRSNNGMVWKKSSCPADQYLNDIAWSGKGFTAVGNNGTLMTSKDGKDWHMSETGTNEDLNSVSGNNEKTIAVGKSGSILLSENSTKWSESPSTTKSDLYSVDMCNGITLVSGDNDILGALHDTGAINHLSDISKGSFCDIIWDGSRFIASGSPGIFGSSDGDRWLRISDVPYIKKIVWNGKYYIALAKGKDAILRSDDCISWVKINLKNLNLSKNYYFYNIVFTGGKYFLFYLPDFFSGPPRLCTSPDGITWTQSTRFNSSGISSDDFMDIASNNIKDLALYHRTVINLDNRDTVNLDPRKPGFKGTYFRIIWGGNKFVMIGSDGDTAFSTNGENWIESGIKTAKGLEALAWNSGIFAAAGKKGALAVSEDGIKWTAIDTKTKSELFSIALNNSHFAAIGEQGLIISGRIEK